MDPLETIYKDNLVHDLVVAEKRDGEEGVRETFRMYLKNYPGRKTWIQDVADQYMIDISDLHEASYMNEEEEFEPLTKQEKDSLVKNGKLKRFELAAYEKFLKDNPDLPDSMPKAIKAFRDYQRSKIDEASYSPDRDFNAGRMRPSRDDINTDIKEYDPAEFVFYLANEDIQDYPPEEIGIELGVEDPSRKGRHLAKFPSYEVAKKWMQYHPIYNEKDEEIPAYTLRMMMEQSMNLKEQYTRLFNGKPRGNDGAMIQERMRLSDMSPEAQELYNNGRNMFDTVFTLTKGRAKMVALIDDYIKYNPGFKKLDRRESGIVARTLADYAYRNQ